MFLVDVKLMKYIYLCIYIFVACFFLSWAMVRKPYNELQPAIFPLHWLRWCGHFALQVAGVPVTFCWPCFFSLSLSLSLDRLSGWIFECMPCSSARVITPCRIILYQKSFQQSSALPLAIVWVQGRVRVEENINHWHVKSIKRTWKNPVVSLWAVWVARSQQVRGTILGVGYQVRHWRYCEHGSEKVVSW